MKRILTFTNQKGGVGKTTSALSVAAQLARSGYQVLLVDIDPQGNLSKSLLPKDPESLQNTIFTLFLKECSIGDALITVRDNLTLLPCNKRMAKFEQEFASSADGVYILADLLEYINKRWEQKFDFVVIDTPPALGLITVNAFVASTEVYIPMHAQQYSVDGLKSVLEVIETVKKRANKGLEVKGAFFTQHNLRLNISKDIVEFLDKNFDGVLMESYIRVNVALRECVSLKQSVFEYAPSSHGSNDYKKLTEEILNS